MKAILRWYLWLVLSRSIIRSIDWTEAERNAFDNFCRSSCGLKLFEFLRQLVANATFSAVYRNSVSANAHARGMQDVLAVLHRLRVFPMLEEESDAERSLADIDETLTRPNARAPTDSWRPLGGRGAIG
jgi:hypothetical protein